MYIVNEALQPRDVVSVEVVQQSPGGEARHHALRLQNTALYYTALHCIALHCTALNYTALHCTALYCTALQCTTLHCTVLHCISHPYLNTTLHCTALNYIVFQHEVRSVSLPYALFDLISFSNILFVI